MPNGNGNAVFVSDTKDNKTSDADVKLQNDQVKTTLQSAGNELTLMLMDTGVSEEKKKTASEMIATIDLAKEGTVTSEVAVGGELLNETEEDKQETTAKQGMGPLAEQMGEQMGLKADVTQGSFNVATPQEVPAYSKGGIFRFFRKIMTAISSCLVVKKITKWRGRSRSSTAMEDAARRVKQFESQLPGTGEEDKAVPVNEVKSGEQQLDYKGDPTQVPAIWATPLSDGTQEPTVELHVVQQNGGSRRETEDGHSFVVLRYSKEDYRSGKQRMYRLAFGFHPRFEQNMGDITALAATIPGKLVNEAETSSTMGRRFNLNEQAVNAIINEAPKAAEKGFNPIKHNSATFAVNLLQSSGVSIKGVRAESLDITNNDFGAARNKLKATDNLEGIYAHLLGKVGVADTSDGRAGKQSMTMAELETFENSIDHDDSEQIGFAPAMLGEQLRKLNNHDDRAQDAVTATNVSVDTMGEEIEMLRGKLGALENGKNDRMILEAKNVFLDKLLGELKTLRNSTRKMATPTTKSEVQMARQGQIYHDKYFNTHAGERVAAELKLSIADLLVKLTVEPNQELEDILYRMLGYLDVIADERNRKRDEYNKNTAGPSGAELTAQYAALDNAGEEDKETDTPRYRAAFAKVFGSQTYEEANKISARVFWRLNDKEREELAREQGIIAKKRMKVMDNYEAEQHQIRQLIKQGDFTQDEVNQAFAAPSLQQDGAPLQEVTMMVMLAKAFPTARGDLESKHAEVSDMVNGTKKISIDNCFELSKLALDLVGQAIAGQESNFLGRIIQAEIYHAGAKTSKDEVVQQLLDKIFKQFFAKMLYGLTKSDIYMLCLANPSELTKRETSVANCSVVMAMRPAMVEQLGAVVDKLLSGRKVATA